MHGNILSFSQDSELREKAHQINEAPMVHGLAAVAWINADKF